MAKPGTAQPQQSQPEKVRVTAYRIVPHRNADGQVVPERWDTEEIVVSGVIETRSLHERGQTLPAARHRHNVLWQTKINREGPETWKL